MDLSVIVVTHESADYIVPCLRAVLAAEPPGEIEILVVDNRSEDGTAALVRREFPAVRLLFPPGRSGFARNVNLGLREASGRHLLILNPDTEVAPDVLRRLAGHLDARPEVGVVGPLLVNPRGEPELSCRSFPTLGRALAESLMLDRLGRRLLAGRPDFRARGVDWLAGACLMVRREVIAGDARHVPVGLLDERIFLFAEDTEWCYRTRRAGWEVVYDPRVTVLHHKGSGHGFDEWRYALTCQGVSYFFRKHRGRLAAALYQAILLPGLLLRAGLAAGAWVLAARRRTECERRLRSYLRLAARVAAGQLGQDLAAR